MAMTMHYLSWVAISLPDVRPVLAALLGSFHRETTAGPSNCRRWHMGWCHLARETDGSHCGANALPGLARHCHQLGQLCEMQWPPNLREEPQRL